MPTLVLMRHGATIWGEENRFAGWGDTPLSAKGVEEARAAARSMKRHGLHFDRHFTSRLTRAQQTLDAVTAELGISARGVETDWRLNERHYGALQGETRSDMINRFGNRQVVAWRRSYDATPPLLEPDDPRLAEQFARLPDLAQSQHPRGESLGEAVARTAPCWFSTVAPALAQGQNVLVVAHTSSIRGLVKSIESLDDEEAAAFRIATAVPRIYEFDGALKVMSCADLTDGVGAQLRAWTNRLKPRGLGWI
jgi:2,3-bisphosphoglycerate-dependent phosphoglycerate mutase